MAEYEPAVIEEFADRLYKRARALLARYGLLGGLIGGMAGWTFSISGGPDASWWMGALVFGVAGLGIGAEHAFKLKVRAQELLCQLEIEKNTRSDASQLG